MSMRIKTVLKVTVIVLAAAAIGLVSSRLWNTGRIFILDKEGILISVHAVWQGLFCFSLIFPAAGFLISMCVFRSLERIEQQSATIIEARERDNLLLNTMAAAYTQDTLEQKKINAEIERRDKLLDMVNRMAAILLKSTMDEFGSDLKLCMGLAAQAMELDRVYIWKNHEKDGRLFHTQLYEWSGNIRPRQKTAYAVDLRRCKELPPWEAALSSGRCINSMVRDLPAEDQIMLASQGVRSIFVLPVFISNEFWGFVGYDDCRRERVFNYNEQSILSSAGYIIAHAVYHNGLRKGMQGGITALSEIQTELEDALIKAWKANDEKSGYLACMSHDMSILLNDIIVLSGLALKTGEANEEIILLTEEELSNNEQLAS